MSKLELQINQKVDLIVEKGGYKGTYLCKVADLEGDNLVLTAPYVRGELVPLRIGLPVKVRFTGELAAYELQTIIVERLRQPLPLLILNARGEIKRIQRRSYFRLEVKRKVYYRLAAAEGEAVGDFQETNTVDISGGGLKMVVPENFPEQGMLELKLDLPGLEEEPPLWGKIVNNYELPDGKAVGIEFVDIDPYTRELIISWLFDYQRRLRQKGLL